MLTTDVIYGLVLLIGIAILIALLVDSRRTRPPRDADLTPTLELRLRRIEERLARMESQLDQQLTEQKMYALARRVWRRAQAAADREHAREQHGAGGGQSTNVNIASGERSAAVGRDVRRSPLTTGNENEIERGD